MLASVHSVDARADMRIDVLVAMRAGTCTDDVRRHEQPHVETVQRLYRCQRWYYADSIFGNFSGHADGERRGLDRIGGQHRREAVI